MKITKYASEELVTNIFQYLYPVGSIYLSTNSINPSILFGIGEWEQIKDTFLLACGDTYSAGAIGGEAIHELTIEETPSHSHTRGTMNITGCLTERPASSSKELLNSNSDYFDGGAFKTIIEGDEMQWKVAVQTSGETDHPNNIHTFDASRTWEGETSFVGANAAHNNMPPYLAVYIWKRVS